MLHVHILIQGIVQGVGFRYFSMQKAFRFNIKGWVRNNSNGTVEMDAEGNRADMEKFIDAIRQGNGTAVIDSVVVQNIPSVENYQSFDVVYR